MSAAQSSEPHYTKIGEWVSESGANGMEAALYQHLAKRLHHASGSRTVDPSRARLAADLGLKKPDDVDPYLRALEALQVVVIHAKKGIRTTYELPLWPPDDWAGPANTYAADLWQKKDPEGYAAWRAGQRAKVDAVEAPYAAKRRARVAKSAAKKRANVPAATGRSKNPDVPVAAGTSQPVAAGTHPPVATGTNQDDPHDQTNRGDGRRPTPGSSGLDEGGSAASGKIEHLVERTPVAKLRAVIACIPAALVRLLEVDWPQGLPQTVNDSINEALSREQRTVEELTERMGRRWAAFGYEDDLLSETGQGLRTPLGVLQELLSASKCWGNNLDCEDGVDRNTSESCPRCVEERQDRRASAERAGPAELPPVEESETYTAPRYVPLARVSEPLDGDVMSDVEARAALRKTVVNSRRTR